MTGFLLDTNVISETAPARAGRDISVVRWLELRTDNLFLSVVTVAEIEAGIAFARRRKAHRKAAVLSDWLDAVLDLYGDRVLPLELDTARAAGQLSGKARAAGLSPGFPDIAIAATAMHRGLTILTRNLRHFQPLGVAVLDPFLDS
nr:type II toxin-antitoxin system VapC family toxin [uncultured Rhodopila sp.]